MNKLIISVILAFLASNAYCLDGDLKAYVAIGYRIDSTEIHGHEKYNDKNGNDSFKKWRENKFDVAKLVIQYKFKGYVFSLDHYSNYGTGWPFDKDDKELHLTTFAIGKEFDLNWIFD